MMEVDPFEEFEMKPITDGLGFHKKTVKLKNSVKSSHLIDDEVGKSMPSSAPTGLLSENTKEAIRNSKQILNDLLETIDTVEEKPTTVNKAVAAPEVDEVEIVEPKLASSTETVSIDFEVPEFQAPAATTPAVPAAEVPSVFNSSIKEEIVEDTGVRRGAADSPAVELEKTTFSVASSLLDGAVVFACSLMFLASLIIVTGVDLLSVFMNAKTDLTIQICMAVLYLSVYQMYVVVARSFSANHWVSGLLIYN